MYYKQKKQAEETTKDMTATRTIRELKDMEDFEARFFDGEFLKKINNKDWEYFDSNTVPKGMSEILKIGRGDWKKTRTIDINLSKQDDRWLLCHIIYFVRGKTSASYSEKPVGYIVQSQDFKNRVLDTKLNIIDSPTVSSIPLF